MLTAGELRKKFGFTSERLERLIKQGLPVKGKGAKRRFDAAAVARWMKSQAARGAVTTARPPDVAAAEKRDAAEPPKDAAPAAADLVATTIHAAAEHLGVAPRTFAGWLTDPSFPGRAGSPGKGDGYFPIAQIRVWHLATHGVTAKSKTHDEEAAAAKRLKALIDCDSAQISFERELGSLLDRGQTERFLRRMITTAKALHEEMADKVDSRLPGSVPADVRKRIRQAVEEVVAEAMNALAEVSMGDQDETEDVPDDS
jgi:hypothetical protein